MLHASFLPDRQYNLHACYNNVKAEQVHRSIIVTQEMLSAFIFGDLPCYQNVAV